MNKEGIKEFNDIMNMFEVSIYAQHWIDEIGEERPIGANDAIIAQNEYLLKKLYKLSINHVGEV